MDKFLDEYNYILDIDADRKFISNFFKTVATDDINKAQKQLLGIYNMESQLMLGSINIVDKNYDKITKIIGLINQRNKLLIYQFALDRFYSLQKNNSSTALSKVASVGKQVSAIQLDLLNETNSYLKSNNTNEIFKRKCDQKSVEYAIENYNKDKPISLKLDNNK